MILISARKDFWDSTRLADQDEIRDVDLYDDSLGAVIDGTELGRQLNNKTVLLLVHGYNSEEDDVVRAYATIEDHINRLVANHYDLVMGYSWPGGDDPWDYFAAKRRTGAVSWRLARWLKQLADACSALDIMTHSMGTRLALSAMDNLSARSGALSQKAIRNVFTMAAAVDNESIQRGERFDRASRVAERLYVLHSKRDPVLCKAYRAAEFDAPLGLSGPEDPATIVEHSPHVYVANCKRFITRHGGYKDAKPVYRYLRERLAGAPVTQYVSLSDDASS